MSVRFVDRFDYVNRTYRARAEKGLRAVGAEALQFLRSISPVDTGLYVGSFAMVVDARGLKVTIGNPVDYAVFIEYGTSRGMPAYAPIRRTLDEFRPRFAAEIRIAMAGG